MRPDPQKIDSGFLSYFFGWNAFKEHIRAIAVGATMPSLNTTLLSEVLVPHPPTVGEQRAIANTLGTLDDKIELENKTKIFLIPVGKAFTANVLSLAQKLRKEGVNVEMDLMERGISKNMSYANKQGFPFVAVIGENEVKAKEFKLKDMKSGKESQVKFSELEKLKKKLG